jgi:hypothetical protein
LDIYILVVVVNVDFFVDNSHFIHKIKHLAGLKGAVKRRYPGLVIMGQLQMVFQNGWFCTLHAVDIQLLVHSWLADRCDGLRSCRWRSQTKFFLKTAFIGLHPQGYIQG